jgi:hypothetical protein
MLDVGAAEDRPATVEDMSAELFVEVAKAAGELVEDQRQGKRHLFVLETGVAGEDGLPV